MIKIHPQYLDLLKQEGLDTVKALLKRFITPGRSTRGGVLVLQDTIESRSGEKIAIYFKLYRFKKPSWKFWGRASKAVLEFRNYEAFAKLGITHAQPIACGETRDKVGRLHSAFVITKTVPNSATLDDFMRHRREEESAWATILDRRQLLVQIAEDARRMHQAGFFHHDFVWRNILVSPRTDGSWQTHWIDCPRGGFKRWNFRRRRSLLRDLGSFDKSAARHCARTDRLRAFLVYAGRSKLNEDSKCLIRQVLEYRRTRWPDDWPS